MTDAGEKTNRIYKLLMLKVELVCYEIWEYTRTVNIVIFCGGWGVVSCAVIKIL